MKNESKKFISKDARIGYASGIKFQPSEFHQSVSKGHIITWSSVIGGSFGFLSLTEAQELIEVLQAIIADYPKEPTNEEILNELPVGSVVQAYSNVNFMKAGIGWYNPMGYLYSSKRLAQEDFTVKLRGPEDGGDE